jgi:hypothetical protein
MIYVWKRNDGHVDASTFMPQAGQHTGDGVTFKLLKSFDMWTADVASFVDDQRAAGSVNSAV